MLSPPPLPLNCGNWQKACLHAFFLPLLVYASHGGISFTKTVINRYQSSIINLIRVELQQAAFWYRAWPGRGVRHDRGALTVPGSLEVVVRYHHQPPPSSAKDEFKQRRCVRQVRNNRGIGIRGAQLFRRKHASADADCFECTILGSDNVCWRVADVNTAMC